MPWLLQGRASRRRRLGRPKPRLLKCKKLGDSKYIVNNAPRAGGSYYRIRACCNNNNARCRPRATLSRRSRLLYTRRLETFTKNWFHVSLGCIFTLRRCRRFKYYTHTRTRARARKAVCWERNQQVYIVKRCYGWGSWLYYFNHSKFE